MTAMDLELLGILFWVAFVAYIAGWNHGRISERQRDRAGLGRGRKK